jgi:hypothetical protein
LKLGKGRQSSHRCPIGEPLLPLQKQRTLKHACRVNLSGH